MEHREFCRQCIGEYRFRYQDAARQLASLKHVVFTKTPHQDYLIVYHEQVPLPAEIVLVITAREQNPSWQWLASQLMAHTGLTREHLKPDLEALSPQPISVSADLVFTTMMIYSGSDWSNYLRSYEYLCGKLPIRLSSPHGVRHIFGIPRLHNSL